jgi:glucan biosynthesis protein
LGRLHAEAAPFTRATLVDRALRLAAAPCAPPAKVADALGELGYDAYRDFRFRPDKRGASFTSSDNGARRRGGIA